MNQRLSLSLALTLATLATHASGAPPARYEVDGNVVRDTRTKLDWQQASSAPGRFETLVDAKNYCTKLNLDGGGFRLPTLRELSTLVDMGRTNPSLDAGVFPSTPTDFAYWSTTTTEEVADDTTVVLTWGVIFFTGNSEPMNLKGSGYVRCVR